MATAIPNTICLTATGHRRQGQTKRNPYKSLHGHRISDKKAEEASKVADEDVNAPPKDSSDEKEAAIFEAEGYGEASDESKFEEPKVGKPGSKQRDPVSSPRRADIGSPHQSTAHNSGQKRKIESWADEKLNMSFDVSHLKRQRKGVGYGKTKAKPKLKNIHETVPAEQEHKRGVKRKAALAKGETSSNFIRPPTAETLAELNRYKVTSASPSSHASGHNSPDSKCGSQSAFPKGPVFKAPKLPSPPPKAVKAKRSAKEPSVPSQDESMAQTERSSSLRRKRLSPNKNRSKIGDVGNSAAIAATKLGLEDVSFIVPSSTPTVPLSTATSTTTSRLSSPPTSYVDECTTGEIPGLSLDDELSSGSSKLPTSSRSSQSPTCPLCKAPVDGLFLEAFAGNRRMTIRQQAQFCKAHKRRSAEEEWQAKGYPTIDWPFLHMQVKIHREAVDEILTNERHSVYRNAYEDYLKREKHRTLRQSLVRGGGIEDFSPGYYGSRGARIMIDNLMATFASKLRLRAATDRLISSRGISSYVQAVLVPELATLLVMDDLKVDAEEARQVLQDSVELGNFLNEEEDEVIKDPEMNDGNT